MKWAKVLLGIALLAALASCALVVARSAGTTQGASVPFRNLYDTPEDTGERVRWTYFFRRAWVQLTRDLSKTAVPPTIPLDFADMEGQEFAAAWLGHASLLVRVSGLWVLIDPIFSGTAGPVQGFGPQRLTPLPFPVDALPRIDVVLISHDHYDHLDLETMRRLAGQPGGAPRIFAGTGLSTWFKTHIGVPAREFGWWESATVDETVFLFVPAQHSSGRDAFHKNTSLWGGWVIRRGDRQFYFPGDTAFVAELFADIRKRVGPIDVVAMPIGAYEPRQLMRFEHLDPGDALHAHNVLEATNSFGVHWGTFQLGDEEPFQAALDLAAAMKTREPVRGFGLMPIGGTVSIDGHAGAHLCQADRFQPSAAHHERPAAERATTGC